MTLPKILVIDDDRDHLLLCKLILERRKYEILALPGCDPLHEFIDQVRIFQPQLIFIDHEMPGICGDEAIRELRSHPDLAAIPVVYFSAHIQLEQLALKAGVEGYVKKPFSLDDLLSHIRKHIDHRAA